MAIGKCSNFFQMRRRKIDRDVSAGRKLEPTRAYRHANALLTLLYGSVSEADDGDAAFARSRSNFDGDTLGLESERCE